MFNVAKSLKCSPNQCSQILGDPSKYFNIVHSNIRSINKNLDQFLAFLGIMNFDSDIMVLSECWLKGLQGIPQLDGYSSYYTHNNKLQNDGVVIYARRDLNINVWEPTFEDGNCLVCTIGKKHALIGIYRSPSFSKIDNFISSLNKLMPSLESFPNVALIGDINIDIKANNIDRCSDQYLTSMTALGMLPAHTFPTRENKCLDHILLKTNITSRVFVFDSQITDHSPTMLCIDNTYSHNDLRAHRTTVRVDYDAVKMALDRADFTSVIYALNADQAADQLVSIISSTITAHTKTITTSSKKVILKPWITPGLLRCMRNRDLMHKKLRKDPDNHIVKVTYVRYRNFLNNLLSKLKREYQKNEINKAKTNPKAMWNVLKKVTNSAKRVEPPRSLLNINEDPCSAINSINKYFVSVARDLADKIAPSTVASPSTVFTQTNSLALLEVDFGDIERIICGLRDDCAAGWDRITPSIIKASRRVLIPPITHVCNLAISTSVFPKVLKRALVSPIYKQGDRGDVANYRPISVLPAVSKILERVLNNSLVKFLDKYNIIAKNQFGFRSGICSEDAIAGLTSEVVSKLDSKKKCFGIFLDLSKAFDTVSIPILINKLETCGIRGPELGIFRSYLSDRTQCVRIDSLVSDVEAIGYGVPQGSILGPTLFQIYVNDLCRLNIPNCSIYVYADDTALVAYGDDWQSAKQSAQDALEIVVDWLSKNLLTLNVEKTQVMPFSITSASSAPPDASNIVIHTCPLPTHICDCPPLRIVSTVKYLGVHIDSNLKWHSQIEALKIRVRKLTYIFLTIRHLAEPQLIKTVYVALCQSILAYCIPIWGGAGETVMLNLERAQRAILKIMTHRHIRYSTKLLYSECQVLTVRQLYILKCIIRKHAALPLDKNITSRRRTSVQVCRTKKCNTAFAKRQYDALSSKLYNKLHRTVSIYTLSRYEVIKRVTAYLLKLSYSETENLLK